MLVAVPDEVIADTILELREKFGAVSCETQTIRGGILDDEMIKDKREKNKGLRHYPSPQS